MYFTVFYALKIPDKIVKRFFIFSYLLYAISFCIVPCVIESIKQE